MATGVGTPDIFAFTRAVLGDRPTITGMEVMGGPSGGGTTVTLTGTGFTPNMTVQFGDVAVPYTFVSATTIKTVSPAHAAGTVTITVTSIGLTASAPHTFAFVNPAPLRHTDVPLRKPQAAPTVATPVALATVSANATTASGGGSGAPGGSSGGVHLAVATTEATPNPAPPRH